MANIIIPILYSFRRCPYAMRARISLVASGQVCELREVVLRNKPAEMLAASPKGTVPVLIDRDNDVIDESLDIMLWGLGQNDPQNLLDPDVGNCDEMLKFIADMDGPFKRHLDCYKYSNRQQSDGSGDGMDAAGHREAAVIILRNLEDRLKHHRYLFGSRLSLADIATAPFVRQFAHVDKEWFDAQPLAKLHAWLSEFLSSDLFCSVMHKYEPWTSDRRGVSFPSA
ncbi:MAG: glutathione S-transferase [Hyphomicrobiaceae bacterium]